MTVRVVGVRHHSPACARLVAHLIATEKPHAVLIEGPSDFNPRIPELLLEHTLPLALYSYANADGQPRQCWFPFLDYSPEWLALREGHVAGALLRFIDLPHWQYRALPDARRRVASVEPEQQRSRYAEVVERLCRRFGCDGDHALWDHLFESLPADAAGLQALQQRLDLYFDELRGDDPGSEQDQARERRMAEWVAWAERQAGDRPVLVVCGGWHKRAIEAQWPALRTAREPVATPPLNERQAGSYLVPFEFRQVEALSGYWAGMQSPQFYQWAWQHGLASAGERAVRQIIGRLRSRHATASTADLVAFERCLEGLSRLRGHAVPLRADILDALQSTLVKDALERPAPWVEQGLLNSQHHPVLREAMIALTGEGAGRLHADTPLPPLLHDVTRRLAEQGVAPSRAPQPLVLDRRREADARTAAMLWQLQLLEVDGIRLHGLQAPHAARHLPQALRFEEHWSLQQGERWFPSLIEAAVYGATLESAARHRLQDLMHQAQGHPAKTAQCLLQAVRAGLLDLGTELAQSLHEGLPGVHDHVALAEAAHALLDVAQAGFWGADTRGLMEQALLAIADRLLWLLDGLSGAQQPARMAGDVNAVRVFDALLRLGLAGFDSVFVLETLARFARADGKPPALRGAALGVAHVHGGLGEAGAAEVLAITRAIPPRDALGDFLYGLFSCARALATQADDIVLAVQGALESMSTDDFLVALPQLRGAFSWFPPQERGAIAARVAQVLGLSAGEQAQLLSLRQGAGAYVDAKRMEAQALAWARELGVLR